MVLRKFCPNQHVDSLAGIDLEALAQAGIKGIIVDVDNTLVEWDKEVLSEASVSWVKRAKELGLGVCIVSNGKEERVARFAGELEVPGFAKAIKPRKKGFLKALEVLGTKPEETAIVGDQLFTDVLGGNRTGLYTIWMTPLSDKELFSTKCMRRLEQQITRKLEERGMLCRETSRDEEKAG
ncbi:MAG: YqeG family HAD IIIA-type phosphatase [Firmicutes bacterium]|nr:YqeG family HAD IIIA-type phosphatase [Bacillota bacterium]